MLKPINTAVIIKKVSDVSNVGGMEVSGNMEIRYHYGEVLSSDEKNIVKAGDFVYYDSTAGNTIRYEGDTVIVLKERHIEVIDEKE